jgi:DNA gyrase subunit B
MTKKYDASSIKVLKGLEPVRKNPSMYIGNTNVEGLHHLVYELIDNSVDEHLAGHCNVISVVINKDETVSVEDDGRGIPVDIHKEEKVSALELVMCTLNAGGKFDRESYKVSGGIHGLGASIINALAEWCCVEIKRDGNIYKQEYVRGVKKYDVKVIGKTKETGTKTTFKPDHEIFSVSEFDFDVIAKRLKERAYLNKGLKLTIKDEHDGQVDSFEFNGGLFQFIEDLNQDEEVLHPPIYIEKETKNFQFEVAFQYTKKYSDNLYSFANNINTVSGGVHLNGFKNALLKTIEDIVDKEKILKDITSTNILPRDVIEGLTAIISIKLPHPQFEGQTKTKLNNYDIRAEIDEICIKEISTYFKNNEETAKKIILKVAETVRARDAAAKARTLVRKRSRFDALDLPIKLTDCVSKEREKCEVFLCEGDSASASAKGVRNKDYQAILALKGKVLNVECETINSILDSKEIKNIISTVGIDINKANTEKTGLRYDRIIIMTDADVDGLHITALLLTLFYRYMRKLIDDGHIYVAKPPLYKVVFGSKSVYLNNDKELEEFKKKHQHLLIQRFKGLGEMNAEQLYDTTMDPNNRKLEQVFIVDDVKTGQLFVTLMGEDVAIRREFIMKNSKNAEMLI